MNLPNETQRRLIVELVKAGSSQTEAQIMLDLAMHAVDEALKTVTRVAETAETKLLQMQVAFLAFRLIGPVTERELAAVRDHYMS